MHNLMRSTLAVLMMAAASVVNAAATDCSVFPDPGNALNALVVSEGCNIGSTNNHSETQVNLDAMFGSSNWVEIAKFDLNIGLSFSDPGPPIIDILFDNTYVTGDMTIDWTGYLRDIMVVFKDGEGAPPYYVGHLLTAATYGDDGLHHYTIESAFFNQNGGLKDISNMGFYSRPDPRSGPPNEPPPGVPIPGTAALLGAGLLMRRKRQSSNE